MKRLVSILILFAVMLPGTACTNFQRTVMPTELPRPVDPRVPSDPSQPIEVSVGDTFEIVVSANLSTGYHWELVGPLDDRYLIFTSREYIADEPVMPGSAGIEIWTFQATAPGETIIALGNYPPAQGAPSEDEIRFSIVIR